jgi:uncharacterized membrane protein YedE/YeeE
MIFSANGILTASWPWYAAGPIIACVMLALLYLGRTFAVSTNLRTLCSLAGAGRASEFFRYDWKRDIWNLVFVLGALLGGAVAAGLLAPPEGNTSHVSPKTISALREIGMPLENGAVPVVPAFFNWTSPKGLALLLAGGFLVGFGARYAGGCTSGHSISGLANLQLASLLATVGFFVGGIVATFLVLPVLFSP